MKVYRIIPLDRKGEQDGNEWFTMDKERALSEMMKGNEVSVADALVTMWKTAFVIKEN